MPDLATGTRRERHSMPSAVSTLGFPRTGPRRELKIVLERYWAGNSTAQSLLNGAKALRAAAWARQHGAGVTHIASNDFSLYDHVLDTSAIVGAIPDIYGWTGGEVSLDTYFAMAWCAKRRGARRLRRPRPARSAGA
jgi:5-methyltetrahydropteroyltriglutamate--homocysteine methyltransferase